MKNTDNEKLVCRKCSGPMGPGIALINEVVQFDRYGSTCMRAGVPVLVKVLKCKDCGHSLYFGKR